MYSKAKRQYVHGGHFTSRTLYKGKIVSIQYISNSINIDTKHMIWIAGN
jgi:hypothetical protein